MMTSVTHPGELLQTLVLEPAGISQAALARLLGFNQPQPVNELIKGRRGMTPKMALLVERLTEARYPAEFWMLAQLRWELAEARVHVPHARLSLVEPVSSSNASEADVALDKELMDAASLLLRSSQSRASHRVQEDAL